MEIKPDLPQVIPNSPSINYNRKIDLELTEEFQELIMSDAGKGMKGSREALGHLMFWAFHDKKYNHVSVHGRRDGDINAVYMNDDQTVTYNLYALRQEDGSYSYHS